MVTFSQNRIDELVLTVFETIRPRGEGETPLEIDTSKEKILLAYQSVAGDIDSLEGIDESEEEQSVGVFRQGLMRC